MTIFNKVQESSEEVVQEEVFEAPVIEGYSEDVNGDVLALQESWEDYVAVIESIHALDMAELQGQKDIKSLQESGADEEAIAARTEEMEAAMEAAGNKAVEGVKTFFTNLWKKLKAFFDSVRRSFDLLTKSGEDFVTKHAEALRATKGNGYKTKMFDYTNLEAFQGDVSMLDSVRAKFNTAAQAVANISGITEDKVEEIQKSVNELKDSKDGLGDKYRGEVVGASGPLTANEFKQHLFSMFRNGAKGKDDKVEVTVDPDKLIEAMKNKEARDQVAKAQTELDNEFKEVFKHLSLMSKDIKTGNQYEAKAKALALETVRVYSSLFSMQKSISMTAFGAWKAAWFERNAAYKVAALGLLHKKAPKAEKEDQKEAE